MLVPTTPHPAKRVSALRNSQSEQTWLAGRLSSHFTAEISGRPGQGALGRPGQLTRITRVLQILTPDCIFPLHALRILPLCFLPTWLLLAVLPGRTGPCNHSFEHVLQAVLGKHKRLLVCSWQNCTKLGRRACCKLLVTAPGGSRPIPGSGMGSRSQAFEWLLSEESSKRG